MKTVFVCNTLTGGIYEVKKGFGIDETSIRQIQNVRKRAEKNIWLLYFQAM